MKTNVKKSLVAFGVLGIFIPAFANSQTLATATLTVDCTNIRQTVNYRRGWAQPVDASINKISSTTARSQLFNANLVTATLDLNQDLVAGPQTQPLFDHEGLGAVSLGLQTNQNGLSLVMANLSQMGISPAMPALIQLSGTPKALPVSRLDNIDYQMRDNLSGNFYPLPLNGDFLFAQSAVTNLMSKIEALKPGNIWLGTQEPSHTLGDSLDCDPNASDSTSCQRRNVDRYLQYWKPIAMQLRANGLKVGGIQLNSANRDLYVYAAQKIMAEKIPLDYFTVQRYASYVDLMPNLYAAYKEFQKNDDYKNVKIIFNRYGSSKQSDLTTALGMSLFLHDEREIMQRADMMYGYARQTIGLTDTASLLPQVMQWLQKAPAHLRDSSFSPLIAIDDLEAVALVSMTTSRAYLAVWNNSTRTTYNVPIVLSGAAGQFAGKIPVALKGHDNPMTKLGTIVSTQVLQKSNNNLSGVALAPGDFVLISLE